MNLLFFAALEIRNQVNPVKIITKRRKNHALNPSTFSICGTQLWSLLSLSGAHFRVHLFKDVVGIGYTPSPL